MVSRDPYDVVWYDEYLDQITGGNVQLLTQSIEIHEYEPEGVAPVSPALPSAAKYPGTSSERCPFANRTISR